MHFPFHCFKSAPCALHFLKIFYFVVILSEWNLKPSNLKTIEIYKRAHRANKYMLKVHNRSTRRRWEIWSKLTIKTPERRHWPRFDVFKVNFTYFARFSSASIVDFEQVNISYELVPWISIYSRAEDVIAPLSLLLILLLLFYC